MSIESLKERVGSFIENQKKKKLEDQQARLGFTLVAQIRETLGISLVDHQPDPDYLFWGKLVQLTHRRHCIQSLDNPDIDTSINALIGVINMWRDQISSLTDKEFSQKLAGYDNEPNDKLMKQFLTELRYAPEDRSSLAVLKEENQGI